MLPILKVRILGSILKGVLQSRVKKERHLFFFFFSFFLSFSFLFSRFFFWFLRLLRHATIDNSVGPHGVSSTSDQYPPRAIDTSLCSLNNGGSSNTLSVSLEISDRKQTTSCKCIWFYNLLLFFWLLSSFKAVCLSLLLLQTLEDEFLRNHTKVLLT